MQWSDRERNAAKGLPLILTTPKFGVLLCVTLSLQVRFRGSPQSIHPSWIGLFRLREWAPSDKFVPRVFWCLKSHVSKRILNIWWTERVWHETDLYPGTYFRTPESRCSLVSWWNVGPEVGPRADSITGQFQSTNLKGHRNYPHPSQFRTPLLRGI